MFVVLLLPFFVVCSLFVFSRVFRSCCSVFSLFGSALLCRFFDSFFFHWWARSVAPAVRWFYLPLRVEREVLSAFFLFSPHYYLHVFLPTSSPAAAQLSSIHQSPPCEVEGRLFRFFSLIFPLCLQSNQQRASGSAIQGGRTLPRPRPPILSFFHAHQHSVSSPLLLLILSFSFGLGPSWWTEGFFPVLVHDHCCLFLAPHPQPCLIAAGH
ncbi:hypothetical protein GALMADRAFT_1049653 [Galerina marginata CBS 339.88]|uniref:Uncharacterized protein n=1 Tax=Galerina marginata (strain CBS 339.88) TaxID=685588 RepID=A0A067SE59_GALM3|nr:hypothetical protein GALMADRAFT_1049653 [Galerina marginata CBS 339.88]